MYCRTKRDAESTDDNVDDAQASARASVDSARLSPYNTELEPHIYERVGAASNQCKTRNIIFIGSSLQSAIQSTVCCYYSPTSATACSVMLLFDSCVSRSATTLSRSCFFSPMMQRRRVLSTVLSRGFAVLYTAVRIRARTITF